MPNQWPTSPDGLDRFMSSCLFWTVTIGAVATMIAVIWLRLL